MHTETVAVKHVVCRTQLHDGVLSHAVARKLDKANFIFDDKEFRFEQGCLDTPAVQGAGSTRLADLCLAVSGRPTVGSLPSGQRAVHPLPPARRDSTRIPPQAHRALSQAHPQRTSWPVKGSSLS